MGKYHDIQPMKPRPSADAANVAARTAKRRTPLTKLQRFGVGVGAFVLLVGGGVGVWLWMIGVPARYVDQGSYQAVFLTSNQVYFGKLQRLNDGSIRLTDVYYPQTQNTANLQTESTGSDTMQAAPQLVKFGSELLGAQDQIVFPETQVQYWVNLKTDSKVSQAINAYRAKS